MLATADSGQSVRVHQVRPHDSAGPSPLVIGNGFGFAVYSFPTETITKFYAHPYRFVPRPDNPLDEGIETANFVNRLAWDGTVSGAEYLHESHIIETSRKDQFVMPFGLNRNALMALSSGAGCLRVDWAHPVVAHEVHSMGHANVHLLQFQDVNERLALIPLEDKGVFQDGCMQKSTAWLLMSLEQSSDLAPAMDEVLKWRGRRTPTALLTREFAEMESWRSREMSHFRSKQEKSLWRQSESILRMAQSREPNRDGRNNHGLILASLPEGMWFVSWVRDMAYATVALIRMGHREEARNAVLAYFNARPIGRMESDVGGPYQISVVRYFGDGSEEPFFTMEGATNIEYDNWGLALWVVSEYVRKFHDLSVLHEKTYRGPVYDVARDLIAYPLLKNLEAFGDGQIVQADTSIWEEYQPDKKHFAFSTAAAINGLSAFTSVAHLMGDHKTVIKLRDWVKLLQKGFAGAFINNGFVTGTSERNYKNLVDSAVLESINFGIIKDAKVATETISQMEALRMASGGYRRVRGDTDYEKQEFLYSNFSLARNYLRLGQPEKGYGLVDTMVRKAVLDHGLIPEMYVSEINDQFTGQIGDPTGSIPMVGYGAGIFTIYMMERQASLLSASKP